MNTLLSLEHLQIVRIVIEPVVLSGVGQSGSTGLENAHLILLNNPMPVLLSLIIAHLSSFSHTYYVLLVNSSHH